jgi:2-dehydro-3-deoxyphosphooctonate aldolase (KDO 8-P synthase)
VKLCGFEVGLDQPLFLIAGPCVIESRELAFDTAGKLQEICRSLGLNFIYKSSYDKANRSSGKSFRGLGMEQGLAILADVRNQLGVPVLTDVHAEHEVAEVASVVDVLQTPAFLCRQTDFIHACAASGKPVNIKKGQFMAPGDMKQVVLKAKEANGGADSIMVCERGASFGYNNLVSDMRSLAIMRETGCPVVFDATHSVQLPGGQGDRSTGVGAGGGGCRRRRPVHGNPPRSGQGHVRRPQRLAAAANGGPARTPAGTRCADQAEGYGDMSSGGGPVSAASEGAASANAAGRRRAVGNTIDKASEAAA